MAATLKLIVATPTGEVYANQVDSVVLPGRKGELGILPEHTPLITLIGEGEIVARRGTQEDRILVTGGAAEITGDQVSVLTVFATNETAIDLQTAEAARQRAEARLKEKLSPEETALVRAAMTHSTYQIRIKRRGSHH